MTTLSTSFPSVLRAHPFARSARRMAAAVLSMSLLALAAGGAHADGARPVSLPVSTASGSQASWHFSGLPGKQPTRFEEQDLQGQRVLKVEADDSYGNLVHSMRAPLEAGTTLSWRWRVDQFVAGTDLRSRAGDDGIAKLCVFFDFPADRLSFGERAKLALAKRSTGEDVPSETLCYVWDEKAPRGETLASAFTDRIRLIVLRSGPTAMPGAWVHEKRDLLADYQQAFGREAQGLRPDVLGIGVSADADNTHGRGVAWYAGLRFDTPRAGTLTAGGEAPRGGGSGGE